jgi:hypothetical protein
MLMNSKAQVENGFNKQLAQPVFSAPHSANSLTAYSHLNFYTHYSLNTKYNPCQTTH